MQLLIKVNYKKFILFSLTPFLISLSLSLNWVEFLIIAEIYVATIINQWMLILVVKRLVLSVHPHSNARGKKWVTIFLFFAKLIVLFGSIAFGVHFMRNRIIIPILNYVLQIFALSASLVFIKVDR